MPASTFGSLLLILLLRARTRQDAGQAVVAFMAGVFVKRSRNPLHRQFNGPWLGVNRRIDHRRAVNQQVGSGPREPLGNAQVFVAHSVVLISEAALLIEAQVGGLDDQGIAFPMAP